MKSLSKTQMCLVMRNGVEIWIDSDRAKTLQEKLHNISGTKFIIFDDRTFNSGDILGLFKPSDMEELTRRKNGQWKCDKGNWHSKNEECNCHIKVKDPRGWTK